MLPKVCLISVKTYVFRILFDQYPAFCAAHNGLDNRMSCHGDFMADIIFSGLAAAVRVNWKDYAA